MGSHLALDWTNVYGIRLLLPFSGEWLRADTTAVVDLCIWPCVVRHCGTVSRAAGGLRDQFRLPKERHHGRGFAWFALYALFYNCGRGSLHARAVVSMAARMYDGVVPMRVAAMPDPVNPLKWRGIVETPGHS